jgi:hypothetical protein
MSCDSASGAGSGAMVQRRPFNWLLARGKARLPEGEEHDLIWNACRSQIACPLWQRSRYA